MNFNYGYRIVDYLGGQGLTWNQPKRIAVTSFGYPADAPFDGGRLWTCPGWNLPRVGGPVVERRDARAVV